MEDEKVIRLQQQLDALKIFPNNNLVKELRKQTKRKLKIIQRSELKKKISKNTHKSNISRSNKLKKYHRYIRLIRNNFPDLSVSDIRKQFSTRRKGHDVSIPDVIWQNPSP